MTMPHEEVRALKNTKEHLRKLRNDSYGFLYFFKLTFSRKLRDKYRSEIHSCLRHYPFGIHIDKRYEDVVCSKCEETKEFCKCPEKK